MIPHHRYQDRVHSRHNRNFQKMIGLYLLVKTRFRINHSRCVFQRQTQVLEVFARNGSVVTRTLHDWITCIADFSPGHNNARQNMFKSEGCDTGNHIVTLRLEQMRRERRRGAFDLSAGQASDVHLGVCVRWHTLDSLVFLLMISAGGSK